MKNSKQTIYWLLSITLLFCYINLSAQDNFYYYKGEKMQLELNPEYVFISGVDKKHIANAKVNNIPIDIKNSTETEEDNTSERLLKRNNLKVKYPTRYRKEIKLEGATKKNYLSQIEALRETNPDLIIAPYFKNESIEKIGLSNYFHVKLKQAEDFEIMRKQIEKHDLELIGQNQFMPLWYSVSVTPNTLNALKMANIFYETGLFQYATPDFLVDVLPDNTPNHQTTTALTPNDPLYPDQWHLKNTGQHGGIPGMDINAEAAWDITLGDHSIVVAVIDEGFQTNHPDLIDNVVNSGYNAPSGSAANVYGPHGTACAGIIGGKGNNNKGISGVAPNTGLMPVSFQYETVSVVIIGNAISWAWMNGADVISNSWRSIESELISDPIDNALTMGRGGLGTIVVFSAGNNGFPVHFPANSHPDVLAVGAMSPCGERKTPSSCDGIFAVSNFGVDLDIVAPGVLISTTDLQSVGGYNTGDNPEDYADLFYHNAFGGTSSACPQVAGVAALILSVNPNLTGQQVRDIIEQSARKVRPDLYNYGNTSGRPNGTWNGEMGYGLLDAHAAVSLAAGAAIICSPDATVACADDIVLGATPFETSCTGGSVAVTGPVITGVPDCPGTTYTYTFTGTDNCGTQEICTRTFTIQNNEATSETITLVSENDLFVGVNGGSFAANPTYQFTDPGTAANAVISNATLELFFRVENASCERDIQIKLIDPAGNVVFTGGLFTTCNGSGTHPFGQLYSTTIPISGGTTTGSPANWVVQFRDTNDQNANAAEYSVRFGRLIYNATVTPNGTSCCGSAEFTSCPQDISMTVTPGHCGGIATWTPPTATGGAMNSTHHPGEEFPVGCTTVIYSIAGTNVTCSFDVCVECNDGGTPGSSTTETITLISDSDLFIGAADAESFSSNGTYVFADPGTPAGATISNATLQLFFRVENASCERDIQIRVKDPAGNVVFTGPLFTTCAGSGTHPFGNLYQKTISLPGGTAMTTGSVGNWVVQFRDTNDQNTNANEYSVRFGRLIYDATVTTSGASTENITLIDDDNLFVGFNDTQSFSSNGTHTFSDPGTPANAVLSNITLQMFFRVEGASCERDIEIRVKNPAGNVVYTGPMFTTCMGSGTHPFGNLYQNTISLPGGTAMTTGSPGNWIVQFRDTNDQNAGANEYSVKFGRLIYDATISNSSSGGCNTTEAVELVSDQDVFVGAADAESFASNGTYLFATPGAPANATLSNIELLLFFRVENASCERDIQIRVIDPAGNVVFLGSPFTTCNGSGTHPFGQLYDATISIPNASTTSNSANWVVQFRDTNDQNVGKVEYSVRFGRMNYDLSSTSDCGSTVINQSGTPNTMNRIAQDKEEYDIKLYPVPTTGRLILEYAADKDQQIQVEIFNVNGQTLRNIEQQVFEGLNTIDLEVYEFPDGMYFVKTTDNLGTTKVKPFTKLAP